MSHTSSAAPVSSGSTARLDIIAGLTASAIVIPKSMAFATVAGVPVSVGLYTALLALVIYSLLGTSRVLSVSSTTTLAILAGAELALVVPDGDPAKLAGALAALTSMVGLMLLAGALLRLGFVANFISAPVLTGFKAGVGIVIVGDQLPKLLGIHISKHNFFADLVSVAHHLPESSLLTMAVAATTMIALFIAERVKPHSPAPLLAVGLSILASWYWKFEGQGVSIVGLVPRGLPSFTMPDLGLLQQFVPGAMGIALMSFTESIAAARAFARPDDGPVQANRELLALGAANLGAAVLGGMPAGGGTSQTAVVKAAGGRSQVASMATAAAALATMMLLAPILGLLPNATLAAVVIVYSVPLIQPAEFRAIGKVRAMELRWALIACVGVLLFGTLQGIVIAIIVSLVGLSSQSAHPHVYVIGRKRGVDVLRPMSPEHPDDETIDGLLILRPEGRLFFANVQYVSEQINALVTQYQPRVLALDLSRVTDLEYSVVQALMEGDRRISARGVTVWLAGLSPDVLDVVRRSGLADQLGDRMLFNARAAIARYQGGQTLPVAESEEDQP